MIDDNCLDQAGPDIETDGDFFAAEKRHGAEGCALAAIHVLKQFSRKLKRGHFDLSESDDSPSKRPAARKVTRSRGGSPHFRAVSVTVSAPAVGVEGHREAFEPTQKRSSQPRVVMAAGAPVADKARRRAHREYRTRVANPKRLPWPNSSRTSAAPITRR